MFISPYRNISCNIVITVEAYETLFDLFSFSAKNVIEISGRGDRCAYFINTALSVTKVCETVLGQIKQSPVSVYISETSYYVHYLYHSNYV